MRVLATVVVALAAYAGAALSRGHRAFPLWVLAVIWIPAIVVVLFRPSRRAASEYASGRDGADAVPRPGADSRVQWSPYDGDADRAWRQIDGTEPDAADSD